MSNRKRLERIEKAVAERVAELKEELDKDPAAPGAPAQAAGPAGR